MKVLVLVKASPACEAGELPSAEAVEAMSKFNEELAKAGMLLALEGLQPSSKGVRVKFSGEKRSVTDGPFAETKDLVAGFWLWKVKSLDEAVAWIKRAPFAHDVEVELRPVHEYEDFAARFAPKESAQEALRQPVAARK